MPSMKRVTIKITGNANAQPTIRRSSATSIFISRSCPASQSAYFVRRKNIVTAEQSSTPSSETPLHKVLGSRSMIQANTQMETPNRKNAIFNIASSLLPRLPQT